MMNFVLGLVAGALIAAIATIAAARDPGVQAALGLRPAVASLPMAALAPARPEKACIVPAPAPRVGSPEMLFSKRRFWSVAP